MPGGRERTITMEAPRETQTTRTAYEGGTIDQAAWDAMCSHTPAVIDPMTGEPYDDEPDTGVMRGVDFRGVTFRAPRIRLYGCHLQDCTFEPVHSGSMQVRLSECTGSIRARGHISLRTVGGDLDMDLRHADIDTLRMIGTICSLDMYDARASVISIDRSVVKSEFLGLVTPDLDAMYGGIITDSYVYDELADGLPGLRISGGKWEVQDPSFTSSLSGPAWVDCTPWKKKTYALPTHTPWPAPDQPDTDATPTTPTPDADTEPGIGI